MLFKNEKHQYWSDNFNSIIDFAKSAENFTYINLVDSRALELANLLRFLYKSRFLRYKDDYLNDDITVIVFLLFNYFKKNKINNNVIKNDYYIQLTHLLSL